MGKIIFLAISLCFFMPSLSMGQEGYYSEIIKSAKEKTLKEAERCSVLGDNICNLQLGFYYLGGKGIFKNTDSHQADLYVASEYFSPITGVSPLARLGLSSIEDDSGYTKTSTALVLSAATDGLTEAKALLAFPSEEGNGYVPLIFDKKIYWSRSLLKDFPNDSLLRGNMAMVMINNKNSNWWHEGFRLLYEVGYNYGDISFQKDLADVYAEGRVTPRDYVMAYMMYDLAGTGGLEKKQALAEKLTPEQIEDALNRSHEWQRAHHSYRPNYESGSVPIHWNMHRE